MHTQTHPCYVCGKQTLLSLTYHEWESLTQGMPITEALSERSAEFHELIVHGTHMECWTPLFSVDGRNAIL